MKTNPNEPITPTSLDEHTGLTKREYFAAMAMQGNHANPEYTGYKLPDLLQMAVESADALIVALNKKPRGG